MCKAEFVSLYISSAVVPPSSPSHSLSENNEQGAVYLRSLFRN
jgi:hypothetical protein